MWDKFFIVFEDSDVVVLYCKDYCGKYIRYDLLSLDDDDSGDYEVKYVNSFDYVSSCLYLFVVEEVKKFGRFKKKRKVEIKKRKVEICSYEKFDLFK